MNAAEEQLCLVYVTAPNEEVAEELAKLVVSKKLAACVNILPSIKSVYIWEEKLESQPEVLLVIKTRRSRFDELESTICENHPYDVPEVILTEINDGSENYLNWLLNQTNGG